MVSLQALAMVWALSGAAESTLLLDFYSDSCGPCRQMAPVVSQLAAAGYPVRKVNVDRERELAARFGINRIPCFVMVVDGKEVDRLLGVNGYDRLEAMCKLALVRSPIKPITAPVQLASNASAAPVLTVPAVHSEPVFGTGAGTQPAPSENAGAPGWRMNEPAAASPAANAGPSDADLIAATVRLHVQDPSGQSCGTGTIIDAREGQALILTCGHLFRDSQGKGRIEVDLFGPNAARAVPGQLIGYDAKGRDVGLVSIRTSGPVAVARVAPPGYRPKKGDLVTTVGCNNGDDPTVRHSRVTAVDKFGGEPNLEVAGQPVQGRSGGGLFSSEGFVIGVCNAADPADNEGLFAALGCIYAQLDDARLATIYQQPVGPASPGAAVASATPSMPREMPQANNPVQTTAASTRGPATNLNLPMPPAASGAGAQQPLRPEEQAALDEIHRRQAEGAEVVFVIRSRSNPDAKSEVFVLDKASPAFVQQLTADRRAHVQRPSASTDASQVAQPSARQLPLVPVSHSSDRVPTTASSNWQPHWLGTR